MQIREILAAVGHRKRPDRTSTKSGTKWSPEILAKLEGGDHWEDVGPIQLEFLTRQGLRPEHFLLDVACGSFRGGRFLIDYLMDGHYFGIDGSSKNLNNGIEYVLKPEGLLAKHPTIKLVRLGTEEIVFPEILGFSNLDFIWIHAFFDHIPPKVIRRTLRDLTRVLAPGGHIYATIFLNPHGPDFLEPMIRPRGGSLERAVVTYPDREYWHHTIGFFVEVAASIDGLAYMGCHFDYPHPLGLRVVAFGREWKQ